MGLNGCYTQFRDHSWREFYERPISGCNLLACSQISKSDPPVNLDEIYQGSVELDYLYQTLTNKAQHHWWTENGIELSPMLVNNAFFRAVASLYERNLEFSRSRNCKETDWVKGLLHL